MLPRNYKVEVLDSTLTPVARLRAFVPLDTSNNYLQYSTKLSDYGLCKFRVATTDASVTAMGDIFQPYANHIRITRDNSVVWQGIITNLTYRTTKFIEVEGYTYLFLLSKVLIRHDASVSTGDGKDNYRLLNTGTMATYIQTFLTEAKADGDKLLASLKPGTIENPDFPSGFKDTTGAALTGTWTFSANMTLQFDYRDVLYVIQALATYSSFDFEMGTDFTVNFKRRIGQDRTDIMFEYPGAVEDYNAPLFGERMANVLTGVAADYNNTILHTQKTDTVSVAKYGKIADVAAYIDVKNSNALDARLNEELRLIATPDAELHVTLNEKAYPLGVYQLGDTIRIRIKDHAINVDVNRRIVGIDVKVNLNGHEAINLITNVPKST